MCLIENRHFFFPTQAFLTLNLTLELNNKRTSHSRELLNRRASWERAKRTNSSTWRKLCQKAPVSKTTLCDFEKLFKSQEENPEIARETTSNSMAFRRDLVTPATPTFLFLWCCCHVYSYIFQLLHSPAHPASAHLGQMMTTIENKRQVSYEQTKNFRKFRRL